MKNPQGTVTEPKTLYPWILHMGQDPARSFVPYGYYSRKKKAVSIEFAQKEKEVKNTYLYYDMCRNRRKRKVKMRYKRSGFNACKTLTKQI